MPGCKDADDLPARRPGNTIKKAQKLANGNTASGKACSGRRTVLLLRSRPQIVQFNLKQIGLDVEIKQFARAVQIEKEGTRGEPFDITTEGWIADYADPYDFINVLLTGDSSMTRTTTTSRTSTTRSTTRR